MDALVPTGRFRRLAKSTRAGAGAGAGALLGVQSRAAVQDAAQTLGELRGLAAKVGQLVGYVDGFSPERQSAVFERAMAPLQCRAPHSPPQLVRGVVEQELGHSIEHLFAEWEPQPFASASIGQVHRARLHNGLAVAVKVQHPGIVGALEADLLNASLLEGAFSKLSPRALNATEVFEFVAERFREELDYLKEADNLREFRAIHALDDSVHLPRVVDEHSRRRVLTCSFCGGESLSAAQQHPEPFREYYAETLWRFAVRSIVHAGVFNADPNPGNYLFAKDSKVVFLDFGCVQRLSGPQRDQLREMHRAACQLDETGFRRAVVEWFGACGGAYENACVRFMRQLFRPIFESPFEVNRQFVRHVVYGIQELKKLMFMRDGSVMRFPPEMLLLNRLQFGLFSVLARLDVSLDYAQIAEDVLAEG